MLAVLCIFLKTEIVSLDQSHSIRIMVLTKETRHRTLAEIHEEVD